jgi:hypothetical protein
MRAHTSIGLWFAVLAAFFLWEGLRPGGRFHANWPARPIGRDRPIAYAANAILRSGFAAIGLMMVAHDLWGWRSLF